MASTQQQHTLHSVTSAFNQWRTSGKNRNRVPDELRKQAVSLLKSYRKNEILRALGTNHSMLNRWAKELAIESPEPSQEVTNPEFVPLPMEHTTEFFTDQATDNNPPPMLTMVHASGWTLQWHRLPDDKQLHRLLSSFQQLNNKELV